MGQHALTVAAGISGLATARDGGMWVRAAEALRANGGLRDARAGVAAR